MKFITGWRQVAACFMVLGTAAIITAGFSVLAIPLGQTFHPSRMMLMMCMTLFTASTALASPFLGNLMDRTSMKLLMVIGVACLAGGLVAVSFATEFWQVLLIFGLLLPGANILMGPMIGAVLLSRWFNKKRGMAIGFAIAGIGLGGALLPPIMQSFLNANDWRVAFRLIALMAIVITVPAIALIVNRPSDKGLFPDGAESEPQTTKAEENVPVASVGMLLKDPSFWIVAALCSVVTAGMLGVVTNLMPLALDQGIAPKDAAYFISIFSGCAFLSKISFAAVADKVNLRTLVFGILGGFAAGCACLINAEGGAPWIAVSCILIGLFGAAMVPLQGLLVTRIFGARVVGRAAGLMQTVTCTALLAAPPAFGLIFDKTGNYDAVFFTFIGLAILAMLMIPHLRLGVKGSTPDGGVKTPVSATPVSASQ